MLTSLASSTKNTRLGDITRVDSDLGDLKQGPGSESLRRRPEARTHDTARADTKGQAWAESGDQARALDKPELEALTDSQPPS